MGDAPRPISKWAHTDTLLWLILGAVVIYGGWTWGLRLQAIPMYLVVALALFLHWKIRRRDPHPPI